MDFQRRNFMLGTAAVIGAGAVASISGAQAQTATQTQATRVRQNINSLSPNSQTIRSLKRAVQAMHALPTTDERSWAGQARIHLDHCHQQRRHFLSWHRLYIAKFEDLVRELAQDPNFALPYWDWTNDRQIPAVFFGANNPLDTRTWNDLDSEAGSQTQRTMSATDSIRRSSVDLSRIENQPQFDVFSNLLESDPHGAVHIAIGGHMGRFLSPLDPIFWIHHCNVDRLWARWNQRFANPTQAAWLNERFDNVFVDRRGQLISGLTARNAITTQGLGYTYDELQTESQKSFEVSSVDVDLLKAFKEDAVRQSNAVPSALNIPNSIVFPSADKVVLPSEERNLKLAQEGKLDRQILLRLSDIKIPKEADGYSVRVFLNCDYLSPLVGSDDRHFVGEFNLFGLRQSSHHKHGAAEKELLFDLTETNVRLNQHGNSIKSGEPVKVQLMSIPFTLNEGKTKVRKVTGSEFLVGKVELLSLKAG